MRILTWAILVALFILLLAFAAKNSDPVTLRFYFDLQWKAPLIALLLAFFVGGVVLGLLAMLSTWYALRREIARLRRSEISGREISTGIASQPPAAEG
jgi:uncharacterized integral membrane protein